VPAGSSKFKAEEKFSGPTGVTEFTISGIFIELVKFCIPPASKCVKFNRMR